MSMALMLVLETLPPTEHAVFVSRREKIVSVEVSAAAVLLAGFRSWLAGERGLSRETVRCYGT
jgi:hypothetical protein